jgi:hypothetical protein
MRCAQRLHLTEIQLGSAASCRNWKHKHKNNNREREFAQCITDLLIAVGSPFSKA